MVGTIAVVAGFLGLALTLSVWFWTAAKIQVTSDRKRLVGALLLSILASGAGLWMGTPLLLKLVGWGTIVTAAIFIGLQPFSKQVQKEPAIAVGDKMLTFTALDDQGKPFDTASLQSAYMLKFFRGHW